MLAHCSPLTLALVSVAITKVALSLQGLDLAKCRKTVPLGLRYVGSCIFFCARVVQPARIWATLSGTLLHSPHITSPVAPAYVFWQAYSLGGSNCS